MCVWLFGGGDSVNEECLVLFLKGPTENPQVCSSDDSQTESKEISVSVVPTDSPLLCSSSLSSVTTGIYCD